MRPRFKVKSIEVEVGKLLLHSAANRDHRPTRVKFLVNNMDLDAIGRFAIWRDNRNLYVIDGQHRKLALEELGLADFPVRCDVYEGMTFNDACEMFLQINNQLSVSPFDKFDKGVKAGRMECVETQKIIESFGLQVNVNGGDGKFTAVVAATDTWKLDQGESLARALTWSTQAWGLTATAVEGMLIRGLGLVATKHNGALDDAALIKKLAKFPGGGPNLIGAAKSRREINGGTTAKNIADIAIDLYNKGRRTGRLAPL